jgi:uncharacterized protein
MMGEQAVLRKENVPFSPTKTVGLISDTHVPKLARCIPPKVLEVFQNVDFIIHAGDLVDLSVIDELEQVAPVLAVKGNMDCLEAAQALPELNSLKIFDWKIGVTHNPDLMGFGKIVEIAKQNCFNVLVYGHTHVSNVKWEDKVLFINPGSPTNPATAMSQPSVGLLRVFKETIVPQIINV